MFSVTRDDFQTSDKCNKCDFTMFEEHYVLCFFGEGMNIMSTRVRHLMMLHHIIVISGTEIYFSSRYSPAVSCGGQ